MKDSIVKNVVNDFAIKNDINSNKIKAVFEEFLWKSIRELRNEDEWLYEHIYNDYSTRTQFDLLTQRLEMEFANLSEETSYLTRHLDAAIVKADSLNENDSIEYVNDYCQSLIDDIIVCFQEGVNSDDDPKESMKEKIKEHLKEFAKEVLLKLPTISTGLGTYLASITTTGLFPSLLVFVLLLAANSIYMTHFSTRFTQNSFRDQIDLFRKIAAVFSIIGDMLKQPYEGMKYRYMLTFKNEERCYKKAGIDYKDLSFRHFMAIKEDSIFRMLMKTETEDKLDILRNCFVEAFLERIALFFDLYFECLKKSGRWNDVREMSDDKILSMIHMKGNLYPVCDEYRNNAVKAIKAYEDLIDFIYEKHPDRKSKWLLLLNRYILDAKQSKDKTLDDHRSDVMHKRPGFVSDRSRRIGADINADENYERKNEKSGFWKKQGKKWNNSDKIY